MPRGRAKTTEPFPVPAAEIALTRNQWLVPFVSPFTVNDVVGVVGATFVAIVVKPDVAFVVDCSTRYPVMGSPPIAAGGAHASVTEESPPLADIETGLLGLLGGPAILRFGTITDTTLPGPDPADVDGVTRNCTIVPAATGFGAHCCCVDTVALEIVSHEEPPFSETSTR